MNYYRRYIGDYLKKTSRISILEHGAYSLLLDYYYVDERPLPRDKDEVYRLARATQPAERRAIDRVLRDFFALEEDGYHNKRADEELAVARVARENGGKGGRPRKTQKETQGITHSETQGQTGSVHPGSRIPPEKQTGSVHPGSRIPPEKQTGSGHPFNHSTTQPPNLPTASRSTKPKVAPVALPEWLNAEKFRAWIEIRPAKARTRESQLAAIEKLAAFKAEGLDPNAIVFESLANGWQGIFHPKDQRRPGGSRSVGDANRAAVDEAVRRMQEEQGERH